MPETSRDFFDSFPVTVHDQSDPELERAVNDFAHSFESIKQVIIDYGLAEPLGLWKMLGLSPNLRGALHPWLG